MLGSTQQQILKYEMTGEAWLKIITPQHSTQSRRGHSHVYGEIRRTSTQVTSEYDGTTKKGTGCYIGVNMLHFKRDNRRSKQLKRLELSCTAGGNVYVTDAIYGQKVGVTSPTNICPVSYTHLDVYKRQLVLWQVVRHPQIFPVRTLTYFTEFLAIKRLSITLLCGTYAVFS